MGKNWKEIKERHKRYPMTYFIIYTCLFLLFALAFTPVPDLNSHIGLIWVVGIFWCINKIDNEFLYMKCSEIERKVSK